MCYIVKSLGGNGSNFIKLITFVLKTTVKGVELALKTRI